MDCFICMKWNAQFYQTSWTIVQKVKAKLHHISLKKMPFSGTKAFSINNVPITSESDWTVEGNYGFM